MASIRAALIISFTIIAGNLSGSHSAVAQNTPALTKKCEALLQERFESMYAEAMNRSRNGDRIMFDRALLLKDTILALLYPSYKINTETAEKIARFVQLGGIKRMVLPKECKPYAIKRLKNLPVEGQRDTRLRKPVPAGLQA